MSIWIFIAAIVVALGLTAWAWYEAFDGKGWAHRVAVLVGTSALAWSILIVLVKVVAASVEADSVLRRGAEVLSVWSLTPFGVLVGSAAVAIRNRVKSAAEKAIDAKLRTITGSTTETKITETKTSEIKTETTPPEVPKT